jgi:hypothetical protein
MIHEEYLIIHPLQTLQKQNHIHSAASQRHTPDSVSENGRKQGTQQVLGATSPLDKTRFRLFKISPQTNKSHGKEGELKGIDIPNTSKEKKAKRISSLQAKSPKQGGRGLHVTTQ